jgi:type II secretory pathway pseudopilin PulG
MTALSPPSRPARRALSGASAWSIRPRAARRRGAGAQAVARAGARSGTMAAFTLLETMLAVVIVGVGIVAIVYAQRHFLYQNMWSTHAATATYLANEIRELMRGLPRHDPESDGLYFLNPDDPTSLRGWGPETNEHDPRSFNDVDDFSNAVFGTATDLPDWLIEEGFTRYAGPIDALGDVIPQVDWDGTVPLIEVGGQQVPMPMNGWTQIVRVQKVLPNDFNTTVSRHAREIGGTGRIVRDVDQYPLLVTVIVLYEGIYEDSAPPVTTVSWVVHP